MFSVIIFALYETPLAIFLPQFDNNGSTVGDAQMGYDEIANVLEGYYIDFNAMIFAKKTDAQTVINYSDSHSNFWDVVKIYACVSCEMGGNNPCEMSSENCSILKDTFDKMNTYTEKDVEAYFENGETLGSFIVTENYGNALYGTDETYGECIVDEAHNDILLLNSVLKIDGKTYRVVGKEKLEDGSAISICKKKKNKSSTYSGDSCVVTFVTSDEVKKIKYIQHIVTVNVLTADNYIATYGLTDTQMAYFKEIGSMNIDVYSEDAQQQINVVTTPLNLSQQEFIEAVGVAAQSYYSTYRILPSMTIAQACLESGYGTSALSRSCYNFFGMKWTDGCGCAFQEFSTQEQLSNGVYITVVARFRKYASVSEGIQGYYNFISYNRYKNLVGVTDYKEACRLIRADGWATDLNYTNKLISIIESYNLTAYDSVVSGGKDE